MKISIYFEGQPRKKRGMTVANSFILTGDTGGLSFLCSPPYRSIVFSRFTLPPIKTDPIKTDPIKTDPKSDSLEKEECPCSEDPVVRA
jgi:hypothetical protein